MRCSVIIMNACDSLSIALNHHQHFKKLFWLLSTVLRQNVSIAVGLQLQLEKGQNTMHACGSGHSVASGGLSPANGRAGELAIKVACCAHFLLQVPSGVTFCRGLRRFRTSRAACSIPELQNRSAPLALRPPVAPAMPISPCILIVLL